MRYDIFYSAVSHQQISWILQLPVSILANSQPVEAIYHKNNRKAKLKNHLNQTELTVRDR